MCDGRESVSYRMKMPPLSFRQTLTDEDDDFGRSKECGWFILAMLGNNDVYAVCCMLFIAFSGHTPVLAISQDSAIMRERDPPPSFSPPNSTSKVLE